MNRGGEPLLGHEIQAQLAGGHGELPDLPSGGDFAIGYLSYVCNGDMRFSTREQRRLMVEASHEAYEFLKAKGVAICPASDERFYEGGPRGGLMRFLYFVMAKTSIGDLVACEHCRNAVSEMEQIDLFYEELMRGYPADRLQSWNRLRGQMPPWEALR